MSDEETEAARLRAEALRHEVAKLVEGDDAPDATKPSPRSFIARRMAELKRTPKSDKPEE